MNNNFVKIAIAWMACTAVCTATFAAPKGGNHGGNHGGASRPRRAETHTPARRAETHTPARRAENRTPARRAENRTPAQHVNRPAPKRHEHARTWPHHPATPPHATHRRHIPRHARYCARPAIPLWHVGAIYAWEWIEEEWLIVVNGVYYYGDGYYYDGFNYYYNGACHTAPPPPLYI